MQNYRQGEQKNHFKIAGRLPDLKFKTGSTTLRAEKRRKPAERHFLNFVAENENQRWAGKRFKLQRQKLERKKKVPADQSWRLKEKSRASARDENKLQSVQGEPYQAPLYSGDEEG